MKIQVTGRSREALERIVAALAPIAGMETAIRVLGNGKGDALYEPGAPPDVLVMHVAPGERGTTAALAARDPAGRPPLIVVGPADDTESMRVAIQCGARDFLPEPVDTAELEAALARLRPLQAASPAAAQLTVLIGAAGGVGTSFLAANIAHRYATDDERTLLVDLDLVCSPLLALFDLDPPLGLLDAIAALDTLDAHAVAGYVGRHGSGLHVLGAAGRGVALDGDVAPDRLVALLQHLRGVYAQIVVDAGSRLTPLTLAAAGIADRRVLVTQQSVACVRNAARLLRVLERAGEGKPDGVTVLINRYLRAAPVTEADVGKALDGSRPALVPNDYKVARESCDTGVPLLEVAGHSALSRAISELAATLAGRAAPAPRGFFGRALPILARRSM